MTDNTPIDQTILESLRMLYTTDEVREMHQKFFAALVSRDQKGVVITSKGTFEDNASGTIVVTREDFRTWIATCIARLKEVESAAAGTGTTHTGTEHVVFSNRFVST